MLKTVKKYILSVVLPLTLCFPISPVLAEFNPNYIIADSDLTHQESMNLSQIQDFLMEKASYLAYFITKDRDGLTRRASDMIYLSSYRHQINPKALLVLLQKEQSLVSDPFPVQSQLDWATGYGVCDDCDISSLQVSRFKGFPKQINSAAAQIRYYIDHPEEFYFKKGKTYTIDHQQVRPENTATAALYNYTPHILGNKNFYTIWNDWFGQKRYPDGSIVKLLSQDNEEYWLIQKGKKRKIASKSILLSRFGETNVISGNPNELDAYDQGPEIKFPQFSLLQGPDETVYLLQNDLLRPLASPEVFRKLGYFPDEVVNITPEEINAYQIGAPITADTAFPTGSLLQDDETGGIYFVQDGKRYPVWAKEILEANFPDQKIIPAKHADLLKFPIISPVFMKEGSLVTSPESRTVFVISNGRKRPISSAEIFNVLGYDWGKIISLPHKILEIHPTGDPVK